jgi:hypothetical protein
LHPALENLKNSSDLLTPLLLVSDLQENLLEETKALCRSFLKRKAVDHPDLLFFQPEPGSKTYSMEMVRCLIQEANLPPFEEKFRYFVLDKVEMMLPVHQNALLKVLEEHPPFVKFILLTSSTASLLPTVLSRLKKVFLNAEKSIEGAFPDFSLSFSGLYQALQNYEESSSFVELEGGREIFHSLDEASLEWTLKGQRAEELYIKKKYLIEALYARLKIQNEC